MFEQTKHTDSAEKYEQYQYQCIDLERSMSIGFAFSHPSLASCVFFFSFRRQNGKETFSASWFESLLFFVFRNLFQVSKKKQSEESTWIDTSVFLFGNIQIRLRQNTWSFFAVDRHVAKQQVILTSLSTNKNLFFCFTHLDSTRRVHHITLGPVFVGQDSS